MTYNFNLNLSIQEESSPCFEERILVVDDEIFNLEALKILLLNSKVPQIKNSIDYAGNGLEAVEKVRQGIPALNNPNNYHYGLILMDCSMPIKDGFEAADEIKEIY